MSFTRKIASLAAGCVLCAVTGTAAFAEYPDHPITAIVPFAAGSAVDIVARVVATPLSTALGQPIVVVNKPGADSMIGMGALANAKPDGYTILFTADGATIGPALHRNIPYDPMKQITPVAQIGSSPYVIAINSNLGANSIQEFAALAKKKAPLKLNAASSGNGTRLSVALFALQTGIDIETVTFDGTAQAATSVATGETDFAIMGTVTFASMASGGRIKLLAIAGDQRIPEMPNVPTSAEAGMPDYRVGSTFGVYATGGTSKDIVERLNVEINKVLKTPEVEKVVKPLGVTLSPGRSVADFTTRYQSEIARWKEVVAKAKIPMAD